MGDAETDLTLPKVPSGISGLDEITLGGLPAGRSTLVCGAAGCGKTLMGVQFLVRGILDHGLPGVMFSFEETPAEIVQNVRSLGWDLERYQQDGLLHLQHVNISAAEIQETGAYDLEALFIRLGLAIDSVGAKRVLLDTLENLFAALSDHGGLRSELRRLIAWLKARGVTVIITSERGEGTLTRHGVEEYVSDCVILLDHRIDDQVSTRRMRVVKYRGSAHSSDECPFLIDDHGFSALPLSSMELTHAASDERVSTGVPRLDAMLGGEGYYRGTSVLVSGTPGSGKTTLAATFAAAACRRGERALLQAFEESPLQLIRNMRSVGVDLEPHVRSGLLRLLAVRPSAHGLEAHLSAILAQVGAFEPSVVVVDPLSAFGRVSLQREAMFARLVDVFKTRGITALCTSLVSTAEDVSGLGVSSVIDTWLALSSVEFNGERNRGITVVKSRGMSHSNQVREFFLTDNGLAIRDVYTGQAGVLMGTARQVREAEESAEARLHQERIDARQRQLDRRRAAIEAEIASLRSRLEEEVEALSLELREEQLSLRERRDESSALAAARGADVEPGAS